MLISNSIPEINGTDIDAFSKKTAEKGNFEENSTKKEAYELSFSEEGWKVLGERKAEDEDKKERDISGKEKLSDEEQRKVEELKKIDRKVRIHEQAHLSAAGGYARGGANYNYVTGPDGQKYANGGHVNLDVSPEKDPEATIRKAEVIRRAALAPADPSPSDKQIAAEAAKMSQEAQRQLAEERMKTEQKESVDNKSAFINTASQSS
ncbi:MAG: hypothetical protein FWH22_01220 [Fibromonadales bacterium]|nr:hypothetical protein [Fibromonadales bacterium]